MRTWTLETPYGIAGIEDAWYVRRSSPADLAAERVEVIELEPVLDLLAQAAIVHNGDGHYCNVCGIANSLSHHEDCGFGKLLREYR